MTNDTTNDFPRHPTLTECLDALRSQLEPLALWPHDALAIKVFQIGNNVIAVIEAQQRRIRQLEMKLHRA